MTTLLSQRQAEAARITVESVGLSTHPADLALRAVIDLFTKVVVVVEFTDRTIVTNYDRYYTPRI